MRPLHHIFSSSMKLYLGFAISGAHSPSKPEVLVRGRSEIYVSWRSPEVPQGKLNRYDLLMNGDVIYSGTDLHHTALRLRPDTEYTFIVSVI